METVLIHYSEIGLKGKNRPYFESKLIRNIKRVCKASGIAIGALTKTNLRVLGTFEGSRDAIVAALSSVFGIKKFAFVTAVEKNIEALVVKARFFLEQLKKDGHTSVAFKTRRADKTFPLSSVELNAKFGEVVHELAMKVDYRYAPVTVYTEISQNNTYMHCKKYTGLGGLPVGTSGRALVLLSGGIDSPIAAIRMMRRGCAVDFVHVHPFPENKQVLESKMKELVTLLNRYNMKSRLFVVPYHVYELNTQVYDRFDLVAFKHYCLLLAQHIAVDQSYDALVTGDSLGQVASQTMENLRATSVGITLPVFRPLLSFDKDEIVSMAKGVGTYEISVQPYKDCCSITARNPATRVALDKFGDAVKDVDWKALLDKSTEAMSVFTFESEK